MHTAEAFRLEPYAPSARRNLRIRGRTVIMLSMASTMKRKASLRSRFTTIVLLATLPFFVIASAISVNSFMQSRDQMFSQIRNTTRAIHNLYDLLLRSSITNYLRSKVEAAKDLIAFYVSGVPDGAGLEDPKRRAIEKLLSLQVGSSGYFYGLDSTGTIVFHPDRSLVGQVLSDRSPIKEQLALREGYLEYLWQNSYETEPRKKALYMTYIPEFDWIITATSYRDEFTGMIDQASVERMVSAMSIGDSGYSYVVDRNGELVAHPRYSIETDSEFLRRNNYDSVMRNLFDQDEGFSTYPWRDDDSGKFRRKVVFSKYIEDFDWVVATAMYLDEINGPLTTVLVTNAVLTAVATALLFMIVRKLSASIEKPLSAASATLGAATAGDLSARTEPAGPEELRALGENLNQFIETLEARTRLQERTILEKESLIREIQHRINNNLQTVSSMINLQRSAARTDESERLLRELQARVSVMGIVYNRMLGAGADSNDDSLPLSGFLADYIGYLGSSGGGGEREIVSDVEDVAVQRNAAIDLGLLLNELLSLRPAGPGVPGVKRRVSIYVRRDGDDGLLLQVSDDAGTFSEANLARTDSSLSSAFVQALTAQLGGESSLFRTPGGDHGFRLAFSLSLPANRSYSPPPP